MSNRDSVIEYLEPLFASTPGLPNKVVKSTRELGELSNAVAIVKTDGYELTPEAPHNPTGLFTITLVSPHQDLDKAEEDLDDMLEVLLPHLLTWGIIWSDATFASYDGTRQAVDIRIRSILN